LSELGAGSRIFEEETMLKTENEVHPILKPENEGLKPENEGHPMESHDDSVVEDGENRTVDNRVCECGVHADLRCRRCGLPGAPVADHVWSGTPADPVVVEETADGPLVDPEPYSAPV